MKFALSMTDSEPIGSIDEEEIRRMALALGRQIAIITGRLHGAANCLPPGLEAISRFFIVKKIRSFTRQQTTALLEVLNEDALCTLVDTAQQMGGYEITVYNPKGEVDLSYIV